MLWQKHFATDASAQSLLQANKLSFDILVGASKSALSVSDHVGVVGGGAMLFFNNYWYAGNF